MINLFNLHGAALASLNSGLGLMRVAIGEAAVDQVCTTPSIASIEGDGNAGGGSQRDTEPLLEATRRPIRHGFPNEADRQREVRAIEIIRGELNSILDLTSGSLRNTAIKALNGLQIEDLWLHEKVFLNLEERPHATRPEINTLVTEIRGRKRRPEFQAYAAALHLFEEALSSLNAVKIRLVNVNVKEPFPTEELRGLLDSLWQANEKARACQQEMLACRQVVIDAWGRASRPNP